MGSGISLIDDARLLVLGIAGTHFGKLSYAKAWTSGKTWSQSVLAVSPHPDGNHGDACVISDGSSFYDRQANVWHMLAQCMDKNYEGGWMLCHYTRIGSSPMGPFTPDSGNPVVSNGELWAQICRGPDKACDSATTKGEGTPEIIEKRDDGFLVTFHGWDPNIGTVYRGAVWTRDFHNFTVQGHGLPNDAMISAENCAILGERVHRAWLFVLA